MTNDIVRAWLDEERPEDMTPEQYRLIGLIAAGTATDKQIEAAGEEFALSVKTDPSMYRRHHSDVGKAGDAKGNVIPWVLSTETVDRDGDIIRQRGWDLKAFRRNPVVLLSHDSSQLPIGVVENIKKCEHKGRPALVGDIKFAVDESERAAEAFRLAKAGVLKAGSVGFMPIKTFIPPTDEKRDELGLGKYGVVFEKSSLLEFSLCSVPSNPDAIQCSTEKEIERMLRARAKSYIDAEPVTDSAPTLTCVSATLRSITYTFSDGREYTSKMGDFYEGPTDNGLSDALKSLAESNQRQADVTERLAESITDLGSCIGGVPIARAAEPEMPEEEPEPEAQISANDLKTLEELVTKVRHRIMEDSND